MRNFTKYHLPSKEFSKIVRFNGRDYILHSVYDDTQEFNFDDEIDRITKARRTEIDMNTIPWFRVQRKTRRINEDFFDDMDDIEQEIEIKQDDSNLYNFTIYDKDNNSVSVKLSEDNTKNAIFYLYINFIVFTGEPEDYTSVDDFIYKSGAKNYQMDFSDIEYSDGMYIVTVGGSVNRGFIKAYFKSDNDIIFMIHKSGISNVNKQHSILSYFDFCSIQKYNRANLKAKKCTNYYEANVMRVCELFKKYNINVTVCQPKISGFTLSSTNIWSFEGPDLAKNFSVVKKIPASNLSLAALMPFYEEELPSVEKIYDGTQKTIKTDDYYVMFGGPKNFAMNFIQDSCWQSLLDSSSEIRLVTIKTQNKELRTKLDEHYFLLMPLAKWIAFSPCFLTFLQ